MATGNDKTLMNNTTTLPAGTWVDKAVQSALKQRNQEWAEALLLDASMSTQRCDVLDKEIQAFC